MDTLIPFLTSTDNVVDVGVEGCLSVTNQVEPMYTLLMTLMMQKPNPIL